MKVVFVCLGNICRSPMAEAVFRQMVKDKGLEQQVIIDSAATSSWEQGNPVHSGTRKQLAKVGISTIILCRCRCGLHHWNGFGKYDEY